MVVVPIEEEEEDKYLVFSIISALDESEWLMSGSGLFNLEESASGTL